MFRNLLLGCGSHKYPQHDHCIQCILDLQKSQLEIYDILLIF